MLETDMGDFSIARLPRIEFGDGAIDRLPTLVRHFGRRVLLVTGGASLRNSPLWPRLLKNLQVNDIETFDCTVIDEPSPQLVDDLVSQFRPHNIEVVVGIGGGSPLDAAKAIAGLLRLGNSVMDFLEGVGPELPYTGPAVPLIAVPTTAGTGSEATKNAVLSVRGLEGFKKSFRDEKLMPEYALIDPQLLATCPSELIAANGMDALTQLLESYVSTKANPLTDALAEAGLKAVRQSLLHWYDHADTPGKTAAARGRMAYAALLSGINLAQTGLGSVHGLASPLGAFFPIPHGVVCGTLVAKATEVNIEAMNQREEDNLALDRYARAAQLLTGQHYRDEEEAHAALIQLLSGWRQHLQLAPLSRYGVRTEHIEHIVSHSRGSSMRTNPIVLTDEEIADVVSACLE